MFMYIPVMIAAGTHSPGRVHTGSQYSAFNLGIQQPSIPESTMQTWLTVNRVMSKCTLTLNWTRDSALAVEKAIQKENRMRATLTD